MNEEKTGPQGDQKPAPEEKPRDSGTKAPGKAGTKTEAKTRTDEKKGGKWSTGAKVGAAVGSAAVAAALIYAGRHQMRKADDFRSVKPPSRYENEPDIDGLDEEADQDVGDDK